MSRFRTHVPTMSVAWAVAGSGELSATKEKAATSVRKKVNVRMGGLRRAGLLRKRPDHENVVALAHIY